ncbi:MAG TPA: hypothetical protein VFL64_10505, partial [Rhizobacter sp.]|nr:hypothetical protein [Rhizobacter sp.]
PRLAKLMIEQREPPPKPKPPEIAKPEADKAIEAKPGTPEPVRPGRPSAWASATGRGTATRR